MVAREPRFMKMPARLVLLAGVLVLIATTALLAPSGAVAQVKKTPDVRIGVSTYPYYVIGVGRSDNVWVFMRVANRGRAATPLTYKFTVTRLVGNLPTPEPLVIGSVVDQAIKPGDKRVDSVEIKNLPIGRYKVRVEAVTVGEVKKGDNVNSSDAFSVIPNIWRGTASLQGTTPTGSTFKSDTVPSVTFTFKDKESTGFVYTAAGQVTQTISGGAPTVFAGTGTFDIIPDQSTLILSEDMLVYDILGLPPQGATFKVVATASGYYFATVDMPFVDWLHTGPKDKLPGDTTLAGSYPTNAGVTGDFTWSFSAVTE